MQILGKVEDVQGSTVTLSVQPWFISRMAKLMDGKEYSISIDTKQDSRTLRQNRYMWKLIHEIGIAQSGRPDDDLEIYCQALEKANVKFEMVAVLPECEPFLKKQFRAVQLVDNIGKFNLYKVFVGSSQMNKKEMSVLIDTLLDMAYEVDLDINYWKRVLG